MNFEREDGDEASYKWAPADALRVVAPAAEAIASLQAMTGVPAAQATAALHAAEGDANTAAECAAARHAARG